MQQMMTSWRSKSEYSRVDSGRINKPELFICLDSDLRIGHTSKVKMAHTHGLMLKFLGC